LLSKITGQNIRNIIIVAAAAAVGKHPTKVRITEVETQIWKFALLSRMSLISGAMLIFYRTWGQFHFCNSTQFHLVNSNSASNLLVPKPSIPIPFFTKSLKTQFG